MTDTANAAKILIVDDEKDITTILKSALQKYGFIVDVFNDPRDALSHFRAAHYDLIILDIKMPYINGFELSRELSKRDPKAKIGFMTAFEINLDEARNVFPTLNARFFIRKPISLQKLIEQIHSLIAD
jgi:DNA-binding response OmpR family regulator